MRLKLITALVAISLIWANCSVLAYTSGRTEGEKYRQNWGHENQMDLSGLEADMDSASKGLYDFLMAPFRWVGDQFKHKDMEE